MSSKKQDSLSGYTPRKTTSSKAQPVIVVLEDNDDNDDTATGNSGWVLSFRAKPKVFKPAAATSTPLRALRGARAKTGVREDATDADATAFCTAVASFRNTKEPALTFVGEVVVAIVAATARCIRVATIKQSAGL
jgi:hypothetical protein